MVWIIRGGLCTVRHTNNIKTVLVHLPRLAFCRNMSSSPVKRPVTLLGTMAFGGRADAEQSREMVKAFLDRGHKQVDTAFMYVDGKSEAIIGGMDLPRTGRLKASIPAQTEFLSNETREFLLEWENKLLVHKFSQHCSTNTACWILWSTHSVKRCCVEVLKHLIVFLFVFYVCRKEIAVFTFDH